MNTFQCVLATNKFESFVFFLYNNGAIQWTTGDDSGGVNGLGGNEAIAGISAGDGDNYILIPELGTPCILNIDKTSNVGTPGVWMFKVGTGTQNCCMYANISNWICERCIHCSHIQFFDFGDSQNLLGMTDRYETFRDCKSTIPL